VVNVDRAQIGVRVFFQLVKQDYGIDAAREADGDFSVRRLP
jgi:hypothetical protein